MTDTLLPPAPPAPAAVLGVVADTIGDLTETLWAARTPAELLGTVRAAERLRSVLDAMELSVVAQIEATRAAATEGWASTKDYLTAVTGGRTGEGRRLVALARALDGDRAATGRALAAADVSRTQAQVIVTAVDRLPSNPALRSAAEALLIEAARTRTASDLATIGAQLLERLDPEGTERRDEQALDREERAAHHHRFLSLTEDGLGGIKLTGRGTVEDAALLKAVLLPSPPRTRPANPAAAAAPPPPPAAGPAPAASATAPTTAATPASTAPACGTP